MQHDVGLFNYESEDRNEEKEEAAYSKLEENSKILEYESSRALDSVKKNLAESMDININDANIYIYM